MELNRRGQSMRTQLRTTLFVTMAALGLLVAAVPMRGHHAFAAEFDQNKPLNLRGTVVKWEVTNPHSWIHMDVKGEDGQVVRWMIEGGSPNNLYRLGFTKASLPPGAEIVVEGFRAKDGSTRERSARTSRFQTVESCSSACRRERARRRSRILGLTPRGFYPAHQCGDYATSWLRNYRGFEAEPVCRTSPRQSRRLS